MTTDKESMLSAGTLAKIDRFFKAGLKTEQDQAVQDPGAFRLSIARRRYREGFTTREQFIAELEILQAPEDQLSLEIIAGDLEAAYDYTMDLIATWRDAFRKGNIDIATFTELIGLVVVVPERAATYVARELAKLKPAKGPTLEPTPQANYETDTGKIEVDTIRRLRRKNLISQDDELLELQELGMPADLAGVMVANDTARITAKGEEQ